MAIENVTISVADDHLSRFPEVVQRVQQAGVKVEQQLGNIGVVIGSIDSEKLADLNEVEGVAAVEPSRDIHIAPPDNDLQ